MGKMTIHRGLAELKLIDSKIEHKIETLEPFGLKRGKEGLVNEASKEEDFNADAKAKLQSVKDLIKRKIDIKNAITQANAVTTLTVGSQTMTIAQAINFRDIIVMKRKLASRIVSQHTTYKHRQEKANEQVKLTAEKLAQAALQKDNVKIQDTDAISITEPFMERNTYKLIDPTKGMDLVDQITEEVAEFLTEIDAALSEVNAITSIEIED